MGATLALMINLNCRYACFKDALERVDANGGMDAFTTGYKSFGVHVHPDNSVSCLEWAPGAQQLYLTGDFSKHLVINISLC